MKTKTIVGFQRGTFSSEAGRKIAMLECGHSTDVPNCTTTADRIRCAECLALFMPEPETPLHIMNLDTIEKLEYQGWEGPDASLTISLFEYGFAWRKLDAPDSDGDDVYFIYCIGEVCKFDRCGMKTSTDPEKEWDWAFKGMGLADMGDLEEWREQTFERKVYELYTQYGHENIFGSPYGGCFTIADPDAE